MYTHVQVKMYVYMHMINWHYQECNYSHALH